MLLKWFISPPLLLWATPLFLAPPHPYTSTLIGREHSRPALLTTRLSFQWATLSALSFHGITLNMWEVSRMISLTSVASFCTDVFVVWNLGQSKHYEWDIETTASHEGLRIPLGIILHKLFWHFCFDRVSTQVLLLSPSPRALGLWWVAVLVNLTRSLGFQGPQMPGCWIYLSLEFLLATGDTHFSSSLFTLTLFFFETSRPTSGKNELISYEHLSDVFSWVHVCRNIHFE